MIIICSYCKKYIGEKKPIGDKSFTHSICDKCWNGIVEKQLIEKHKLKQIKQNKERRDNPKW